MPAGEPVGEGRDAQRPRMGCHMDAIGEKRHRSGPQTGDDLDHHHCGCQHDNISRSPLMCVVRGAQEVVIVGEWIGIGVVHTA